jgi:hypothetical protein
METEELCEKVIEEFPERIWNKEIDVTTPYINFSDLPKKRSLSSRQTPRRLRIFAESFAPQSAKSSHCVAFWLEMV